MHTQHIINLMTGLKQVQNVLSSTLRNANFDFRHSELFYVWFHKQFIS